MGSVNRCWNCGQVIAGTHESVPPIRQTPPGATQVTDEAAPRPAVATVPGRKRIQRPEYPQNVFAENCAISSVVVGVVTSLSSLFSVWVLIPAMIGVFLGLNGLSSSRRKTAMVGIGLCCLVFAFVATRGVINAYQDYRMQQEEEYLEF